jgi:hypothetical protein
MWHSHFILLSIASLEFVFASFLLCEKVKKGHPTKASSIKTFKQGAGDQIN